MELGEECGVPLLPGTGIVSDLGEALSAPPVLAGRIRALVDRAVRAAADRGSDPPAHPVLRSQLLHQPSDQVVLAGFRERGIAGHYSISYAH